MYIHSICSISALPIIETEGQLPKLEINANLELVEPNYSEFIPPMQLRRMSKGLKMGLTAALKCFNYKNIDLDKLVAIEVGTAYGMLVDSEAFLNKMIAQNETALTPTAFIQSTHNTISGAIAISLKSHVHNMTFVQRGFSFESAILDADLMLNQEEEQYVLVGGVDEKTESLEYVLGGIRNGMPVGESASFLLLGNSANGAIGFIDNYQIFRTRSVSLVYKKVNEIIHSFELQKDNLIVVWNSAKTHTDIDCDHVVDVSFVVGFNPTGSAMALIFGTKMVQQEQKSVVVVNQFRDYWSVYCIKSV